MKKPKKPGDNISLKTKKNEAPILIEWINSQTNLMDSIRYLIENEVASNGVRNLQNHIPAERSILANLSGTSAKEEKVFLSPNKELAATIEQPTLKVPSSIPPSPPLSELTSANESLEEKEVDDDIDEEDIDSWT